MKFLVDECLSPELTKRALARGYGESSHVVWLGRSAEAALIELTALIAFQNLSSKFNAALDIPSQGFCRAPRK
jgi:alkylhydroperoxidase family enzyme